MMTNPQLTKAELDAMLFAAQIQIELANRFTAATKAIGGEAAIVGMQAALLRAAIGAIAAYAEPDVRSRMLVGFITELAKGVPSVYAEYEASIAIKRAAQGGQG